MILGSDNTAGDAVLRVVGGPQAVERRLQASGFTAIHVNRYEGLIAFEMMGVTHPPPEDEWTLETQRRLIEQVPRHELLAARDRYTRDLRDTVAAAAYEAFAGKPIAPPYGKAKPARPSARDAGS